VGAGFGFGAGARGAGAFDVVVGAVVRVGAGVYEYGEETVCPVKTGVGKVFTGRCCTACDMNRFQIIAGREPPKTALHPSTL
jgi:CO dehydrogenase/acetyl-CoA synthase alpha subunit